MSDPNLVLSGLARRVSQDGHSFQIEIYRLENDPNWSLEVVDEEGTYSIRIKKRWMWR